MYLVLVTKSSNQGIICYIKNILNQVATPFFLLFLMLAPLETPHLPLNL